ncbi:UNVERIFIED_CONTAM: hypothetical protein GTU68_001140 [Idotea baltica]|nr:hypothetical protein [Idotea baltica]
MPAFDYIALNEAGKKTRGILEADSARSVRSQLREKLLTPLEVTEARQQSEKKESFFSGDNISGSDLALITRQIVTLIQAGMPLETCLQAVAKQSEKQSVKRIVLAVRAKVREGHNFADSLGEYPRAFPNLYCATVAAGEQSGHKIQLALVYPVILLVMSLLIVIGLMIYVVPDIVQVIIDAGQQLPLLTQILVNLSHFLVNWGWLLFLGLLLLFVAVKMLLKKPSIKLLWHKRLLNLWLVKRYSRASNAARFISTLAILTRSGIPLVEAMPIATSVAPNSYFKAQAGNAQSKVQEGISLNRALEETELFPPMMIQLISSGEQSGDLSDMLQRAAESQENNLQQRVAMLVGLFEPMTLLMMGAVVLIIVLAVLLPILNLNQLVN